MSEPKMNPEPNKAPVPPPGETVNTPMPDSFDGIRFEIGRIIKYIQDGRKDPTVISTAHKIAELASSTARQMGREVNGDTRDLIWLEGIHAWCHASFEHVSNPANIDLIKTPVRMLRELEIPEVIQKSMWEPIRDGMAKAAGKDPATLVLPKPKTTGSSAAATCLLLALAAAVDITPIKMKFGGTDGTLYYLWGRIHASDKWHDVDIILPKFGDHRQFEDYEEIEILV